MVRSGGGGAHKPSRLPRSSSRRTRPASTSPPIQVEGTPRSLERMTLVADHHEQVVAAAREFRRTAASMGYLVKSVELMASAEPTADGTAISIVEGDIAATRRKDVKSEKAAASPKLQTSPSNRQGRARGEKTLEKQSGDGDLGDEKEQQVEPQGKRGSSRKRASISEGVRPRAKSQVLLIGESLSPGRVAGSRVTKTKAKPSSATRRAQASVTPRDRSATRRDRAASPRGRSGSQPLAPAPVAGASRDVQTTPTPFDAETLTDESLPPTGAKLPMDDVPTPAAPAGSTPGAAAVGNVAGGSASAVPGGAPGAFGMPAPLPNPASARNSRRAARRRRERGQRTDASASNPSDAAIPSDTIVPAEAVGPAAMMDVQPSSGGATGRMTVGLDDMAPLARVPAKVDTPDTSAQNPSAGVGVGLVPDPRDGNIFPEVNVVAPAAPQIQREGIENLVDIVPGGVFTETGHLGGRSRSEEDVDPSGRARARLREGRRLSFMGAHPTAPGGFLNGPPDNGKLQ